MGNHVVQQHEGENWFEKLKKTLFISIFLLLSLTGYSQLNIFDLEVVTTDETCIGNGSITLVTTNATPQATFLFTVYKLPNLSIPISVSSSNVLGNLSAGTYKILATQTLGSLFNDDEEEIVIESVIEPLSYSIALSNQNCSQGGQITLAATSGNIAQCEIISGPVTYPLQTSPVFNNLPAGTYNIRVFDECGEGVVTTYTLELNAADLSISDPSYSAESNSSCDAVTIQNTISAPEGSSISFPITVQYTIHPPNGEADVVITHEYSTGDAATFEISQVLPVYGDLPFTYDIQVTDNCNAVFTSNGLFVNPAPNVSLSDVLAGCGHKYLQVAVSNFKAPFTVSFIAAPEAFNAVDYNGTHPGPFNTGSIQYGGMENPVPAGTYSIEITDACGKTATGELLIEEDLSPPVTSGRNNGCFATLGYIRASFSGRDVVSAVIISAPAEFNNSLPDDVSDFIQDGKLKVVDLPLGTYQLIVTDSCGIEYTVTVEVPPFTESDFTATAIPFCTEGVGSVQIISGNGPLTNVSVVSAPQAFTESLPFDASANIMSGMFFLGDLPEGNYEFTAVDVCGIQKNITVSVTGYHPDAEPFTYVPNCGSFDIVMSDNDTTSAETTYWMQKKHPLTGLWGHPVTGSAYEEGIVPTDGNSFSLQNNSTNYNLMYSGTFRIVKSFKSFVSGVGEHYCIEAWEPFTYNMDLRITNAYTLGCEGNPDDVVIEAENGLMPYTYRIKKKNGQDFIVENGSNNVFSGLVAAVYEFEVTDACGNVDLLSANINSLPSLVTANQPDDMLICTDTGTETNHIFVLSEQTAAILGDQHPEAYTVTYHLTAEDADSNTNALPDNYANISNPQTIYARVLHNSITICHDVVAFELYVNQNPLLEATTNHMCEGEPVLLTAEEGFDSYEWSTGETTRTIMVNETGTYSVTVKEIIGDRYCETTYDIVVAPSEAATIVSVDVEDWTYDQNTITVHTSGGGEYEYSIDGVTYQDSPHFEGLLIGNYTIYVKDKNGCGISKDEVLLLNYPNFFTPNGDGTHDKWRIKYAYMEPDMQINIFDRFGKLLLSLDPASDGWDGTYNGASLPSTDYWFVVTRANGQVHKGHFSMLR